MKTLRFLPLGRALVFAGFLSVEAGSTEDGATKRPPPKYPEVPARPADVDFDELRRETGIKPIVIQPGATTDAKRREQLRAWYLRVFVEPAKARLKDQPYAADAGAFLDGAVDWLTLPNHLPTEKVFDQTAPLWGAGCRDPAVLCLSGIVIAGSNTPASAPGYFSEAMKTADQPGVFRAIGTLAANHLVHGAGRNNRELRARLCAWVGEALHDGSYTDEEIPVLLNHWYSEFGDLLEPAEMDALAASYKHSKLPEWARLALLGDLEVDRAWSARGSDWASKVTPEGWKGFAKHLGLARKQLARSWKLQPDRPEAAARMMSVEMGEGGDQVIDHLRLWFDRATAAQLDYGPAYSSMLRALLPRWHGSYGHLLAFGEACAQTKRYDTDVPERFLQVLREMADEIPDWRALYRQPAIARRVLELNEHLIDEPSHAASKQEWEALRAAYAWICGDYELAGRLMATAVFPKGSSAMYLVNQLGAGLTAAINESIVLGGPGKADFLEAHEHRMAGHWADARTAYAAARAKSPARTAPYIDGEIGLVDFDEAFATGEWTKMPLGKGHPGWERLTGNWTTDDGQFVCHGGDEASRVVFNGRITGDFEVRGHFAFTGPGNVRRSFCFLFDHSPLPGARQVVHWSTAQVLQFGEDPAHAALQPEYYAARRGGEKPVSLDGGADFRLRRNGHLVTFWIDEQEIFTDYRIFPEDGEPPNPGTKIGLGESQMGTGATVEFSRLEIRKLDQKL